MTRVLIWSTCCASPSGDLLTLVPVPTELQAAVEEVLPDLKQEGVRVFYLNSTSPTPGVEALLPAIEAASDEPMPNHYHTNTTTATKAIYIYTSGTTGEATGVSSLEDSIWVSPPWHMGGFGCCG